MKILHVITSLYTGGAEKLMVDLLPRLAIYMGAGDDLNSGSQICMSGTYLLTYIPCDNVCVCVCVCTLNILLLVNYISIKLIVKRKSKRSRHETANL